MKKEREEERDIEVMLNFICQLKQVMSARYLVKLLLHVSVRVLLEEVHVWISRLNKVDCRPLCRWASSKLLRSEQNRTLSKVECTLYLPVSKLGYQPLPAFRLGLGTYTSGPPSSWTFRLQILTLHNCLSLHKCIRLFFTINPIYKYACTHISILISLINIHTHRHTHTHTHTCLYELPR